MASLVCIFFFINPVPLNQLEMVKLRVPISFCLLVDDGAGPVDNNKSPRTNVLVLFFFIIIILLLLCLP